MKLNLTLRLVWIFLSFMALGYMVGLALWVRPAKATNNVTICHKNNGNGWSKISVDDDAVNGFGNGDHNSSSHQGGQDIIPPGYWDFNGRNWDATGQGIWNNNCNVPTPTPTVAPTAVPTVVPTVTPTNTLTPTPFEECEQCEEPTPTPEPTSTPQPLTEPGPGSAPSCSDPEPVVVPWNCNLYRYPTHVELFWIPGDSHLVDVFYKENHVPGWPHALAGIENTGRATVGDLLPNESYTFTIKGRNSCSGGQTVSCVIVDDPKGFFRTNYWLVW